MGSRYRTFFYPNPSKRAARSGVTPTSVQVLDPESESSVSKVATFSAGGFTAQHIEVDSPQGFTMGWQGKPHYLALHDLRAADCEIYPDEQPVARERDLRGRLAFVPSGCAAGGWMVPTADPQSFTALYLDPSGMEDDLGARLQKLPQQARVYFFDTTLTSTLQKLRSCLTADAPPDKIYAESLCMIAAMELCQAPSLQGTEAGMLGGRMLDRVVDFMNQNLHRDIGLDDLAKVANLSRFYFLRAFQRAMRETPYQNLLRRRLERAQPMLRGREMGIAEIALAVGFRSSTQFAAAFRKMMGCTPTQYRASQRS